MAEAQQLVRDLNRKFFSGSGLVVLTEDDRKKLGPTMMNNTTNMVSRLVKDGIKADQAANLNTVNPTSIRPSHLTPLVLKFGRLHLRAMPSETLAITVTQLQAMRPL